MKYRTDKYGNKISVLGYGCMRFTQKGLKLDYEKTEKELMLAYEKGINYFDTAYLYPGSEELLGKFLEKNKLRDRVNIATKLPHYMVKKSEDFEKFFQEELKRLRTDHVDYYLMHMLTDIKSWERLKDLGIEKWLEEKKEKGQIKQVGFSYHGNSDMFCKIIDNYDWDICLIQYNYLDENSQAGKTGLHYAAKKGIPVNIMEPLRGGRLVNGLPDKARKLFKDYSKKMTPVEWSFRWLWNQKEVMCVLSGMNSIEMVKDNTKYADKAKVGEFLKSLCMHAAAMKPTCISYKEFDKEFIEKEVVALKAELEKENEELVRLGKPLHKIPEFGSKSQITDEVLARVTQDLKAELKKQNKPEQIWDKIIPGQIDRFFADNTILDQRLTLLGQFFVMDDKKTIEQVIAEKSKELGGNIVITSYVRYEVGEGLEKKVDDFAAEVAAQIG